jgi:integrase
MADSSRSKLVEEWRAWKVENPDFPLTVNANGMWSKTVRGKVYYFGRLDEKNNALELWKLKGPYLKAGIEPPTPDDRFTIENLVAKFKADTASRRDRGEITATNARDLLYAAKFIGEHLNASRAVETITAEQFAELRAAIAATGRNLRSQKNLISQIRGIFLWGSKSERGMGFYPPVSFGPRFRSPSSDALRKDREQSGRERFIDDAGIRELLAKAKPAMKCMILLGINAGFYAQDSVRLTFSRLHLDHDPPYHDFPRVKNGRPRKAVLWPETVASLKDYIANHRGDDPSEFVILNQYGRPYNDKATGRGIRKAFENLLETAGVAVSPGTSIGSLRHTYGTVVDLSADQQIIDLSMGHAPKGIQKRIYSQRNLGELDRLADLAGIVRAWLFPDAEEGRATLPFKVVG